MRLEPTALLHVRRSGEVTNCTYPGKLSEPDPEKIGKEVECQAAGSSCRGHRLSVLGFDARTRPHFRA